MRVVVATDGSKAADAAVELAKSANWEAGTELRLISVVDPQPIVAAAWGLPPDAESGPYDPEQMDQAQAIVEAAEKSISRADLKVSPTVECGRPASKILEEAEDFRADLIIVGSRGHGTIGSMILGSVSAEIADHAHCPVYVARVPQLRRVVLGVDGSTFSRKAEDFVAAWPIFADTHISVTSVAEVASTWFRSLAIGTYAPLAEDFAEASASAIAERQTECDEAVARLRKAGRDASALVLQGDPASELLKGAHDGDADLIVVGTHGRTGLGRAVFGSVARNVMLHAPCSVMVVREVAVPAGDPS